MRRLFFFVALACLAFAVCISCGCKSGQKASIAEEFEAESVVEAALPPATVEQPAAQPDIHKNAMSKIVVIDAGHQAAGDSTQEPVGPGANETKARVTSGTSGVVTGNEENAINLAVALKLQSALEARGFTVIMVRTTADVNISNSERAAVANEAGADLFIRLHCDGTDSSSTSGFMTLVPGANEYVDSIVAPSAAAADVMHPLIVAAINAFDRGIRERTDLSGFNWCRVPTILFEMGCMSNPEEDEKLGDAGYQQLMADAIADATVVYFDSIAST